MEYLKYSIITPEHSSENIPFLNELYDSIVDQTYGNWECIILTNGKCTPQHLPEKIRKEDKLKNDKLKKALKYIFKIT